MSLICHCVCTADSGITTLSSSNVYSMLDLLAEKLSEFMPESQQEEVLGIAEVKQLFPGPRGLDGTLT